MIKAISPRTTPPRMAPRFAAFLSFSFAPIIIMIPKAMTILKDTWSRALKNQFGEADNWFFATLSSVLISVLLINKEYIAMIMLSKNANGVIQLMTVTILFSPSVITSMTSTVNTMFPTIAGHPNCWATSDPAPATMTTATPNRKNTMRMSIIGPTYLPVI